MGWPRLVFDERLAERAPLPRVPDRLPAPDRRVRRVRRHGVGHVRVRPSARATTAGRRALEGSPTQAPSVGSFDAEVEVSSLTVAAFLSNATGRERGGTHTSSRQQRDMRLAATAMERRSLLKLSITAIKPSPSSPSRIDTGTCAQAAAAGASVALDGTCDRWQRTARKGLA